MSPDRDHLREARNALERAADSADDRDLAESIRETGGELTELLEEDREPDHAVLDGSLNSIRQARRDAEGETAEQLEEGLEAAENYREGISRT